MLNASGSSQLQMLLSGELEYQLPRFRVQNNNWNLVATCSNVTHTLLTTGIFPQNRDENDEKQYPSLVAATLIHQSHQHAIPRFSARKVQDRNATDVSAQVFPPPVFGGSQITMLAHKKDSFKTFRRISYSFISATLVLA